MKRKHWSGWLEILLGALLVALGVQMILKPEASLGMLAWLFGLGAVVPGAADIALYARLERRIGFAPGVTLASGVLNLAVGVMFWAFPEAGKWALRLLFPVWFITHSLARLGSLDLIRWLGGDRAWRLTLALGILGVALGLVMLFNPLLSILSIAAYAAVYPIAAGLAGIYMGFQWIGARRR